MLKRRPRFTTIIIGLAVVTALIGVIGWFRPVTVSIPVSRLTTVVAISAGARLHVALIEADPTSVRISRAGISTYADDLGRALGRVDSTFLRTKWLYDGTWLRGRTWGQDVVLISLVLTCVAFLVTVVRDPARLIRSVVEICRPSIGPGWGGRGFRLLHRAAIAMSVLVVAILGAMFVVSHVTFPTPTDPTAKFGPVALNWSWKRYWLQKQNLLIGLQSGTLRIDWRRPPPPKRDDLKDSGDEILIELNDPAAVNPVDALLEPRARSTRLWWITTDGSIEMTIPLAALIGVFALWPAIAFLRGPWRRAGRPPGHCTQCGYNLTGLPAPRCPECGTEATGRFAPDATPAVPTNPSGGSC